MDNDVKHFFMCLLAIRISFFGKVSVHVFSPFFDLTVCFLGVEFEKFFIDRGYQPFICNIICKYLLRFHRLPFSFVDCLLCRAEACYLDEVPIVHFCFYFLCLWRRVMKEVCCGRCQRGYCLCSPLWFWWSPVSHRGLSSIWSISLYMVRESGQVSFFCM